MDCTQDKSNRDGYSGNQRMMMCEVIWPQKEYPNFLCFKRWVVDGIYLMDRRAFPRLQRRRDPNGFISEGVTGGIMLLRKI